MSEVVGVAATPQNPFAEAPEAAPAPAPAPEVPAEPATGPHADLVNAMAALGAAFMPLRPSTKKAADKGWQLAERPLTAAEATDRLNRGFNLGIHCGASGIIVLDAENQAARDLLIANGFWPTVIPAKAQLSYALDAKHDKRGGAHFWLAVPPGLDARTLHAKMQISLPNGGLLDVLAGPKYAVAPPSRIGEAHGKAYAAAQGGPLDPAVGGPLPVAPLWLFQVSDEEREATRGADLAALIEVLAPKPVHERDAQDLASLELTEAIDSISWLDWLDGDPRLAATGTVDSDCGCAEYHWGASEHDKSATLHEGCNYGSGAHIWSGTMQAELDLPEHCSRLDLATALRGGDRAEVMRAYGLITPESAAEFARNAEAEEFHADAEKLAAWLAADGGRRMLGAAVPGPLPAVTAAGAVGVDLAGLPTSPSGIAAAPAGDPGDFPLAALPEPLRAHAEWVAEAVNVPVALVAPMQHAFLSAACGPAEIHVRVGWVESGPLWVSAIAPPSSRKSAALKLCRGGMDSAEAKLAESISAAARVGDTALAEAREALTEAEDELKEALRAARVTAMITPGAIASVGDPNVALLRDKVTALHLEVMHAEAERPATPELSIDDATPAAMQLHMQAVKGRVFALMPEAGQFFDDTTRTDSSRISTSDHIKMYDNEPVSWHRVVRGNGKVTCTYLTMLAIIQPRVLAAALRPGRDGTANRLEANGAWPRIAATYVPRIEPDEFARVIPHGGAIQERYDAEIERQFMATWLNVEPLKFTLDAEALAAFGEVYNLIERIKDVPDSSNPARMVEAWGKAAGRCLRFARLYAQTRLSGAELRDTAAHHVIRAEDIQQGWIATEWYMASQAYAIGAGGVVTGGELVDEAVAYVRSKLAMGSVTYAALRGSKRHRPYIDDALAELEAAGEVHLVGSPRTAATVVPGPRPEAAAA